ncbi:hypothetical protein NPIL_257341 [Nephila pilipes]|uniref:Uncharacterized protein n=1 Tax=Nephila pilipes TaxID=299642 RepID=A0A8X6PP65_NEPPI|nr:hypothetical protein NPIL_257341 [Nephila pilipes]
MNCSTIHEKLVFEEETRGSIFAEFDLPYLPGTARHTLEQVGEQLNLHPRNQYNHFQVNLPSDVEEEINEPIFEVCELPDLPNAAEGNKNISVRLSDQRVTRLQNACIWIRDHLQAVVEFLRLKLGCQKNF